MRPLRPGTLPPILQELPRIEVPRAPLAPEDDTQLVPFGVRCYRTACQVLLGEHAFNRAPTPQEAAQVSRCMRYLRDDLIPPAAWLRKRLTDFGHTRLVQRFNYPPLHFAFSEKRYAEAFEHDMGWKDDLNYTSYIFGPKARALLGGKTEKTGDGRFPVQTDSTVVHNRVSLEEAIKESKEIQKELNIRVSMGEYVWGINLS